MLHPKACGARPCGATPQVACGEAHAPGNSDDGCEEKQGVRSERSQGLGLLSLTGKHRACSERRLIADPSTRPKLYLSRCPSREDFPLIETEHEAYLRRIKSEFTHRAREVIYNTCPQWSTMELVKECQ